MGGDKSIMRLNSLVDFLLNRQTESNEPPRFLPQDLWVGRPCGDYTTPDVFEDYDDISHDKLGE
jgi:hypothetical protein